MEVSGNFLMHLFLSLMQIYNDTILGYTDLSLGYVLSSSLVIPLFTHIHIYAYYLIYDLYLRVNPQ